MSEAAPKRVRGGNSPDPEKRANSRANLKKRKKPAYGNENHLAHGLRSRIVKDEIVAEIVGLLEAEAPLREADGSLPKADRLAVEMAAVQLLRVRRCTEFLEKYGVATRGRKMRPEFALLGQAVEQAERSLERLGLSTAARSRLGLTLAQTAEAADTFGAQYRYSLDQIPEEQRAEMIRTLVEAGYVPGVMLAPGAPGGSPEELERVCEDLRERRLKSPGDAELPVEVDYSRGRPGARDVVVGGASSASSPPSSGVVVPPTRRKPHPPAPMPSAVPERPPPEPGPWDAADRAVTVALEKYKQAKTNGGSDG